MVAKQFYKGVLYYTIKFRAHDYLESTQIKRAFSRYGLKTAIKKEKEYWIYKGWSRNAEAVHRAYDYAEYLLTN